jgi:type I restriction enzyme R subunit
VIGEADTCRKYVEPKLDAAGWNTLPRSYTEQVTFTDGRIVVIGGKARRRPGRRADYLLRLTRDFPIAVVEAKAAYKQPGDGLQQAKDYAQILDLRFAYATNGHGIVEFDFTTGLETPLDAFPTPDELWARYRGATAIDDEAKATRVLSPAFHDSGKTPRYYQQVAINRTIQAILGGQRRVLLTMATGTGKTVVAFQICWKLWSAGWSRDGDRPKPRILYLADRNILVDDPKDRIFAPFGDARWKIEAGDAIKSRELYFSTYQSIAEDQARPGLYREYARDFFDLVIVDEAHRGSARDESRWREILEWFAPAYQLGMTATPLREENRNTYEYFGAPVYTYSLRQGIDDGFLAPYRVHRVVTSYDAAGWRPSEGELDRYGREIPDEEYGTADFERVVALRVRTEAIARHLTDYLKATDRFGKTIVFCVDQDHASEMRRALSNLNADVVVDHADYVCRVTSDEGLVGRAHLGHFQELETQTPTILTTSQLLTTGIDAPTTKNIVLARVVNSMVEFKQIIGRGTRVRDDYGKLFFTILDYTGSATRLFADPTFDGEPVSVTEESIADDGTTIETTYEEANDHAGDELDGLGETLEGMGARVILSDDEEPAGPRKFYVDTGSVEIVAHLVYELDPNGEAASGRQVHRLHRRPGADALPVRCGSSHRLADARLAGGRDRRARAERDPFRGRRRGRGSPRGRPVRPALLPRLQLAAPVAPRAGRPGAARRSGVLRAVWSRGARCPGRAA